MTHDEDLLAADRQSRLDALDPGRSFIVQAPAGSGKTELLIQRYLCLLGVVDSPEEILAITFTRKAAFEMRQRVTTALRRARDGLAPAADYERITHEAATVALARDRELGWSLIESPGRMRIQTVDAFCAGVSRSVPLSSGLGGIGATVTGERLSALYQGAAAATLDSLDTNDEHGRAVARVLRHLDNHTGIYVSHLAKMLAYRDQWLDLTGGGLPEPGDATRVRSRLERNIAAVVTRHLAAVRGAIPFPAARRMMALAAYAAGNLAESGDSAHPLLALLDRNDLPDTTAAERPVWQALADLLLTQKDTWRQRVNRVNGFPPNDKGEKTALYELIGDLRQVAGLRGLLKTLRVLPAPVYTDGQWEVLLALLRLLPLGVVELRRIFGEQGACDHIEVALAADRALGSAEVPGDVALMLDYRIRHLLVDEMQDTSLGQYRLLTKLTAGWTAGDGRTLFVVGDPMQSIYRFRDAEVGQFLRARERGIGDLDLESLVLRRNFRSGERLVHWFNTVFSQVFPVEDDASAGAIAYAESIPVEAHAGSGHCEVLALFGANADEEAARSLSVISRCLDEHPRESVAVLVRSRTHLTALLRDLRHAGIAYRALEIDRLTDLPEIIDMIALTRALCHEGDRLAWLALLRGPFVGLDWTDLHALVRNDSRRTVIEMLGDESRVAMLSAGARERLANFGRRIDGARQRDGCAMLRDRVERAWYALGGPRLLVDDEQLANVYRFLDVLESADVGGNLQDVRELERLLDQERVSGNVDPDCPLQVMTMHKAKGLEFEHVVLHGLGRTTRANEKAVLSWLIDPAGEDPGGMILSPVGPRAELEEDPLHRFIETVEKDKQRHEMDRLLYVACTRARRSLHLVGSVRLRNDGSAISHPPVGSLLNCLWPAVERVYEQAMADLDVTAHTDDGDEDSLILPILRRLTAEPPSTPPAAPGRVSADRRADTDDAGVSYRWVGARARHTGTIVHRWLQRLADGRVPMQDTDLGSLRATSRHWARSLGVDDADIEPVCERVEQALASVLADPRGQWLLEGEGKAEYAVTGVFEDAVRSIVIDRVRVDEAGVHWIVDYKTGTHEGGDVEGFLEQEILRHRPQLQTYVSIYRNLTDAPVRAALYFPLLKAFREVDVSAGSEASLEAE